MNKSTTKHRFSRVCAIVLFAAALPAAAEDTSLEHNARDAGHALGTAAREVGQGAKTIGKAIGKEAVKVGRAIKVAAKAGGKEFRRAVNGND